MIVLTISRGDVAMLRRQESVFADVFGVRVELSRAGESATEDRYAGKPGEFSARLSVAAVAALDDAGRYDFRFFGGLLRIDVGGAK